MERMEKGSGYGWGRVLSAVLVAGLLLGTAAPASGQELADFDYENLSFQGLGLFGGYIFPDAVESTESFGLRPDLGFLGPGLRIVPRIGYWSSELKDDEVRGLEQSVERLIERQDGPITTPVDLGVIDRSDLFLGLDGHVVWDIGLGFLTYGGAGASVHFLNGSGEAVDDTFVEDLLDSVTAGFNLHAGLEYPLGDRVSVIGEGRFEVLGDLLYGGVNLGLTFFTGQALPGVRR